MRGTFEDKQPVIHETAWVHPLACVVGDVHLGESVSVWPCAVIRGDEGHIVVGRDSNIQDCAVLHTDDLLEVGENVTIGHGAVVHGRKVGNNVVIGINSTVLEFAEIGDNCIVAANALVPPNMKVPANSLVMGVPGQVRPLADKHLKDLGWQARLYSDMARRYRKNSVMTAG